MFGPNATGKCCGWSCGPINVAESYWSMNALPIITRNQLVNGIGGVDPSLPLWGRHPDEAIFDGTNPGPVPEEYVHRYELIKAPGKLAPFVHPAEGGTTGHAATPSDVRWRMPMLPDVRPWEKVAHRHDWDSADGNPTLTKLASPGTGTTGENYFREPVRVELIHTQAAYENGQQTVVSVILRVQDRWTTSESSFGGEVHDNDSGLPTAYQYRVVQFDVATGQILTENRYERRPDGWSSAVYPGELFAFGYELDVDEYIPVFPYATTHPDVYSRHNVHVGKNWMIFSQYDERTDDTPSEWGVGRYSLTGAGSNAITDESGSSAPGTYTGEFNVCRPAFQDHDGEPWVIAYKPTGDVWAVGKWENTEKVSPGGDPEDPTVKGILTSGEVETTLSSGDMSSDARNLCYQQIGERTLAIWYDPDQNLNSTDGESPPGSTGYHVYKLWIYDSNRSTPLYVHQQQRVDQFASPPTPDPCSNGYDDSDDGAYFRNAANAMREAELNENGPVLKYGIPTFITADRDGDVYLGSPQFIAKCGPVARNQYEWFKAWSEDYPLVGVTVSSSCRGDETYQVPLPYCGYWDQATDTHWFSQMTHREFSILPTSVGIQVRGAEGMIYSATHAQETIGDDGFEYVIEHLTNPSTTPLRWQWITDWTISFDGDLFVPHTEGRMRRGNATTSESDQNEVQHAGPHDPGDYSDWLVFSDVPHSFIDYAISEVASYTQDIRPSDKRIELAITSRRFTDRPTAHWYSQASNEADDGEGGRQSTVKCVGKWALSNRNKNSQPSVSTAGELDGLGQEWNEFSCHYPVRESPFDLPDPTASDFLRACHQGWGISSWYYTSEADWWYPEPEGVTFNGTSPGRYQGVHIDACDPTPEPVGVEEVEPGTPINVEHVATYTATLEDSGGSTDLEFTGISHASLDSTYYAILVVVTGDNSMTDDQLTALEEGGWKRLWPEDMDSGARTLYVWHRHPPDDNRGWLNELDGDQAELTVPMSNQNDTAAALVIIRDTLGYKFAFDAVNTPATNTTTMGDHTPGVTAGAIIGVGAATLPNLEDVWTDNGDGDLEAEVAIGGGSNAVLLGVTVAQFSSDPPVAAGTEEWDSGAVADPEVLVRFSVGR